MSERRFSRRVAIHGRLTKPSVRSVPRGGSPRLRRGAERDIAALVELEQAVFAGDRLSLRQFRHIRQGAPKSPPSEHWKTSSSAARR